LIDAYFQSLEAKPTNSERSKTPETEPPTFAGLLLSTGFNSDAEFDEYRAMPKYVSALSRAKLRIQEAYEKRLLTGSSSGVVSAMNTILGLNDRRQVIKTENNEEDNVLQVEIVQSGIKLVAAEKDVVL